MTRVFSESDSGSSTFGGRCLCSMDAVAKTADSATPPSCQASAGLATVYMHALCGNVKKNYYGGQVVTIWGRELISQFTSICVIAF